MAWGPGLAGAASAKPRPEVTREEKVTRPWKEKEVDKQLPRRVE